MSPNTISLPEGPGSIEGLGESFEPTLNKGTGKYAIPIKVPPGPGGSQPELVLSYDGGGGNGPLGFGWRLGLPFIQRQTDKGIPQYIDSEDELTGRAEYESVDVFINEMSEELVGTNEGYWFCENEEAFIRYERIGDHWEGRLPDGTKLEFGLTHSARLTDLDNGNVFRWMLERRTDTNGNTITYEYVRFADESSLNQIYCGRITYGPGAPPWENHHAVIIDYEDRADWFEDGRAGFLVRTGKRISRIVVSSRGNIFAEGSVNVHSRADYDGDGSEEFLNRIYRLDYVKDDSGADLHWSLLGGVTLVGSDGQTELPSTRFSYMLCDPPVVVSASDLVIGGRNEPTLVMDSDFVDLVDLNGDALPDILRTGGPMHQVFLNRGEKTEGNQAVVEWSEEVIEMEGEASNVALDSDHTHLSDVDGNGLADLVFISGINDTYYFANKGNYNWGGRRLFSLDGPVPPPLQADKRTRTADIDFDKRIDIVQGDGLQYSVWYSLGDDRYSPRTVVDPDPYPEFGAPFDFTRSGVQIADFNGDRVPDLVRLTPAEIVVSAGLGYGNFAPPIAVEWPFEADRPEVSWSEAFVGRAVLQDITGDGLVDIVVERAFGGDLFYWINLGNYSLDVPRVITDMPGGWVEEPEVRWADLNGNGTTDLVYADSQSLPRIQTVDIGEIIGCTAELHLLTRIENGIGKIANIEYAPSTKFALEDAEAGEPWQNPMPFPVTVVSKLRVEDSLGNEYTTLFRYHDGYYDGEEKEFRGFGRVEQIDVGDDGAPGEPRTENVTAPSLLTESVFDTGAIHEAMKGKVLKLTAKDWRSGEVFWEDSMQWADPPRELYTDADGKTVNYAHPTGSIKVVTERGMGEPRTLLSEFEFDNYGNQILDAKYGIVEDANGDGEFDDSELGAWDDERIVSMQFAGNTDDWIVRMPIQEEIVDPFPTEDEGEGNSPLGLVVSRSRSFYDDESFSGTNYGEVTVGNLTMTRAWIDPSTSDETIEAARTKFDSYGNPVALFDPLYGEAAGHWREIAYDDAFHAYPEVETIHLGEGKEPLVFQAEYDTGFGTVVASTEFNGHSTTYGYDVLGRLVHIVKPYDSQEFPTIEYGYSLAVPTEEGGILNYVETRMLDTEVGSAEKKLDHYFISRQFVDGLGRKLQTRTEAEPAYGESTPRVVVSGATLFNARRQPAVVVYPHFSRLGGSLDQQIDYEDLSAEGWKGGFQSGGLVGAHDLSSAHKTTTEYDATARPVKVINPDGTIRGTIFNPLVTRSFDENDVDETRPRYFQTPIVYYQDGLERLVRVEEITRTDDEGRPVDALQKWTTRYSYDVNDQLTRILDSHENLKTFGYDGLKRKTLMNDPDRGVMYLEYDAASNIIQTTDAKLQVIRYTYDGANRILTEDYLDDGAEFSAGFTFDPAAPVSRANRPEVAYFYDAPIAGLDLGNGTSGTAANVAGMLAYVWDLSGEEHTSYDKRGRADWTVKRIPDPQFLSASVNLSALEALVSYQTGFAYDSSDRITRVAYPDLDEIGYDYNDRKLPRKIYGALSGPIALLTDYTPSGQNRQINYGNGITTSYGYDSRLRLKNLETLSSPVTGVGGNPDPRRYPLLSYAYSFDGVSNIEKIEDQRLGSQIPAGDPRRNTQTFAYDDLYRLTSVGYSFAPPGEAGRDGLIIDYRYDSIGNMLEKSKTTFSEQAIDPITNTDLMVSGGGPAGGTFNRVGRSADDPPGPHALTFIDNFGRPDREFPYDANGNMLNIDGLACTWDFKDRLVYAENDKMQACYAYDYADRRIMKRVWLKEPAGEGAAYSPRPESVLYPNRYFEVRKHDAPVKYVWNGDTRVARVTGSLKNTTRLQRLRVWPGWNLVSLVVTAENGLQQLAMSGQGALDASRARIWDQGTGAWNTLATTEKLSQGAVLWLFADAQASLNLTGTYTAPLDRRVPADGAFVSSASMEPVATATALAATDTTGVWTYDSSFKRWSTLATALPGAGPGLPAFIVPGEAAFVRADVDTILEVPDEALNIRYYHQDHLGSTGVVTDQSGTIVEETANLPFGETRNRWSQGGGDSEPYGFTQKEKDDESTLLYFEARYYEGGLSRFLLPDPLVVAPTSQVLRNPQRANVYAYARNNPLGFIDPTGLSDEDVVDHEAQIANAEYELGVMRESFMAFVNALGQLNQAIIDDEEGRGIDWGVIGDGVVGALLEGIGHLLPTELQLAYALISTPSGLIADAAIGDDGVTLSEIGEASLGLGIAIGANLAKGSAKTVALGTVGAWVAGGSAVIGLISGIAENVQNHLDAGAGLAELRKGAEKLNAVVRDMAIELSRREQQIEEMRSNMQSRDGD